MHIKQRIYKRTAMQVLYFLKTKFANFWHITRLSTANRCKVINVQKWSGFLPTL